jgi:ribosome-binding ATPase
MEHLGLVGSPDSGHAQLFSALTGIDVPTGFETTKGVAPLPDDRVDRLAEMSKSKKRVHATFEIDFIPGLAPGGKPGEGLGSRLLGSIRDCDAILAVVRADDDADPADALEALELELVLADLGSVEQRLDKQRRSLKGDKTLAGEVAALERAEAVLSDGTPVYRSDLTDEERALLGPVFLLTNKPMLVVVNVAVDRIDRADELAKPFGPDALSVCVEIEGDPDVAQAEPDERAALLADLGGQESVLPRLARGAYHLLGRRTFLTTGEDETRAWSFRAGAKAPECAGRIHSDLQRGFIRAEVIHWDELLEIGSWAKAKELGKIRLEGKEYEVVDGDTLEIRFNV